MSYLNETTKRSQVLERLRSNLEVGTRPSRFFKPQRVTVFEGGKLVIGGEMPAIAIIPTDDSKLRSLACASEEYRMAASIVGVLRPPAGAGSAEWKAQGDRFIGDIQQTIADDRQLGGLVLYVEPISVQLSDLDGEGNRTILSVEVQVEIIYRFSTSDVTD